jgi:(p)ppGpp synthase/HD superfamily hydrolase
MSKAVFAYSRLFDRALVLASIVHEGVPRKGTVVPYIIHPVHVAAILLRHGYGEPLAVAAVLHDVLEDIRYDNGRLQLAIRSAFPHAGLPDVITAAEAYRAEFRRFLDAEFPAPVVRLVQAVTEPKNEGEPRRGWEERKRETVDHLQDAPLEVVALKAADALHNVRSIAEDLDHHGATVFGRFNAPPARTQWYYDSIARIVTGRLGAVPLARELEEAVRAFAGVIESLPAG